jgi:MFS family permease
VTALSTDLVHQENRGKVNGFVNFIGYVMMAFGMLLGNYLYCSVPQLPFYTTLGLIVPEFLIVVFLVHEPKKRTVTHTRQEE